MTEFYIGALSLGQYVHRVDKSGSKAQPYFNYVILRPPKHIIAALAKIVSASQPVYCDGMMFRVYFVVADSMAGRWYRLASGNCPEIILWLLRNDDEYAQYLIDYEKALKAFGWLEGQIE